MQAVLSRNSGWDRNEAYSKKGLASCQSTSDKEPKLQVGSQVLPWSGFASTPGLASSFVQGDIEVDSDRDWAVDGRPEKALDVDSAQVLVNCDDDNRDGVSGNWYGKCDKEVIEYQPTSDKYWNTVDRHEALRIRLLNDSTTVPGNTIVRTGYGFVFEVHAGCKTLGMSVLFENGTAVSVNHVNSLVNSIRVVTGRTGEVIFILIRMP